MLPIRTINEIFRTIPLAFRRVRVCVCLVGFASLQSPWAHTLKASVPCLPLPLHRPSPFLQPLQKNTYHLPCLPLPLHRILSSSQPLQKANNLSPRTKLASLVKGEVLSPEKIRATTGGIATPPSLACTNPSKTALSLENRQHPCLPSKKGRWHG